MDGVDAPRAPPSVQPFHGSAERSSRGNELVGAHGSTLHADDAAVKLSEICREKERKAKSRFASLSIMCPSANARVGVSGAKAWTVSRSVFTTSHKQRFYPHAHTRCLLPLDGTEMCRARA